MEDIVNPVGNSNRHSCDSSLSEKENVNRRGGEGKASLISRVDAIESAVAHLSQRLDSVRSEQHSHCDHLAEVYKDLEEFLRRYFATPRLSSGSGGKNGAVVDAGDSRASSQPHAAASTLPSEVTEVLTDFKDEIERQGQRTESRLDEMQQIMAELRSEVRECMQQNASFQQWKCVAQQRDVHLREQVSRQLVEVAEWKEWAALAHRHQRAELMEELKRRVTAEVAQSRKEQLQGFDKRLGKAEKAVYKELDSRCASAVARAENTAKELTREQAEVCAAATAQVREVLNQLAKDASDITARAESLERQFVVVQQQHEVEREAARSTSPTEGSRTVSAIQEDIRAMGRELQEHKRLLTQISSESPLEGAFVEVKDWLLDLEKRAMSKGEMLELVNRFETDLAEIRRDLHTLSVSLDSQR